MRHADALNAVNFSKARTDGLRARMMVGVVGSRESDLWEGCRFLRRRFINCSQGAFPGSGAIEAASRLRKSTPCKHELSRSTANGSVSGPVSVWLVDGDTVSAAFFAQRLLLGTPGGRESFVQNFSRPSKSSLLPGHCKLEPLGAPLECQWPSLLQG